MKSKITTLSLLFWSCVAAGQIPANLHVETADSTTAVLENTNPLGNGQKNALFFKYGNFYGAGIKAIGNGPAEARLGFFTYAAPNASGLKERLSILDNGRVGIGTNNPLAHFHLKSYDLLLGRFERGAYGSYPATAIELVSSPPENVVGIRIPFSSGTALAFGVPGLTVMPGTGNVEISAPASYPISDFQAKLYVVGAEMPNGTAAFAGTANVSHFNYSTAEDTYLRGGKSTSKVFINDASSGGVMISPNGGFTGIATAFPFARFHVKGESSLWLQVLETGSNWWGQAESNISGNIPVLSYGFNGNTIAYIRSDNGAYISLSDQNLKTNITPLGNTLHRVMQLRPVSYQMKSAPTAQPTIGLIAQEAQVLFPETVAAVAQASLESETQRGESLHGINYDAFGIIAIKAIQEQQAVIEVLQKRLVELENLVEELRK